MSAALRVDDCTKPSTPCLCGWCERYGKQDVFTNARPLIRNDTLFLEIAGRCTRCHHALHDSAFMVRERVVAEIRYNAAGHGFMLHDYRRVPVCEACVTDDELERVSHKVTCKGCGLRLSIPRQRVNKLTSLNGGRRLVRAECSNACFRRVLRKRRRMKGCSCTCGVIFMSSSRRDAKFCSSACREAAYRTRGATQ
jgi:hypothetical protein